MKRREILLIALFFVFLSLEGLQLTINAVGFSGKGKAIVIIFEEGQKFKASCENCLQKSVQIEDGQIKAVFDSLSTKHYAVMVYHDENQNGKMDTNFFGMPKEGVGVSNNSGGIPSFKKSKFILKRDKEIQIEMKYL